MARKERARSFLFEPGRFKNDEAVRMMSLEARGAYAILFCELWDQPELGVVPDDDRLLASLARATPEEWGRIATDVRRAFDAQQRPGYLVQRGLVATATAQDRFVATQSHAGHVGANARWAKDKDAVRMRSASTPAIGSACDRDSPSVLGSRFSGSEKIENQPPLPDKSGVRRSKPHRNGNGNGNPPDEWTEAFHEHFWPAMPKKVDKDLALKAWRKVQPQTEDHFNVIMDGLTPWLDHWAKCEPDKILYPERWIKRARWEVVP